LRIFTRAKLRGSMAALSRRAEPKATAEATRLLAIS